MKNTVLYVSLVAASKYIGAGVAVSVLLVLVQVLVLFLLVT